MEFNEKLQQLRKKNNLTQEQLAEQLFVSRTAVSKWESGKGYPNIESLKSISKLFSVSIDDLLSGDELISLAECENRSNIKKVYGLMGGIIDVMAAAFIFLPLYGKPEGGHIYHVNLLSFTDTTKINLWIYWGIFCFLIVLGIMRLILTHYDKEAWLSSVTSGSVALSAAAICFFAAAREPYVTVLMFLFFVWKITLLYYIMNRKQHQAKTLYKRDKKASDTIRVGAFLPL